MIGQTPHHILLFLDFTSYIDDLRLQVFVSNLHEFAFGRRAIGLSLLIVGGKLIFLNELEKFHVITL